MLNGIIFFDFMHAAFQFARFGEGSGYSAEF
jgi:hypothetical protein